MAGRVGHNYSIAVSIKDANNAMTASTSGVPTTAARPAALGAASEPAEMGLAGQVGLHWVLSVLLSGVWYCSVPAHPLHGMN